MIALSASIFSRAIGELNRLKSSPQVMHRLDGNDHRYLGGTAMHAPAPQAGASTIPPLAQVSVSSRVGIALDWVLSSGCTIDCRRSARWWVNLWLCRDGQSRPG
jgi:hypothetical protein